MKNIEKIVAFVLGIFLAVLLASTFYGCGEAEPGFENYDSIIKARHDSLKETWKADSIDIGSEMEIRAKFDMLK